VKEEDAKAAAKEEDAKAAAKAKAAKAVKDAASSEFDSNHCGEVRHVRERECFGIMRVRVRRAHARRTAPCKKENRTNGASATPLGPVWVHARYPRTMHKPSVHDHMILRVDLVGSHGRWKRPSLQTAHMPI
jgi:hypothetical protein